MPTFPLVAWSQRPPSVRFPRNGILIRRCSCDWTAAALRKANAGALSRLQERPA